MNNKVSLFLERDLERVQMSLNNKTKLVEIAKVVCRELRKNSTKAERIFVGRIKKQKIFR